MGLLEEQLKHCDLDISGRIHRTDIQGQERVEHKQHADVATMEQQRHPVVSYSLCGRELKLRTQASQQTQAPHSSARKDRRELRTSGSTEV